MIWVNYININDYLIIILFLPHTTKLLKPCLVKNWKIVFISSLQIYHDDSSMYFRWINITLYTEYQTMVSLWIKVPTADNLAYT